MEGKSNSSWKLKHEIEIKIKFQPLINLINGNNQVDEGSQPAACSAARWGITVLVRTGAAVC